MTLGAQKDNYYEITSGLKGDELLAASNLNQIVTGMQVSVGSGEEVEPGDAPQGESPAERGGRGQRQGGGQ